ncbi:MAG: hypothetical protein PF495_00715 [Spirochaetales bacterium]|jgi:hypothetical protein|nr:hypothetical protein [Spirochaetales bacterium]
MTDLKVKTTITVSKQVTLDESELEQLLVEYGCNRFQCEDKDITVEIQARHGFLEEVRIICESTQIEEG